MDRARLEDLVLRFTEAFNDNDLEAVMSFLAEDAVYEEFTGAITRGHAAIRRYRHRIAAIAISVKAAVRTPKTQRSRLASWTGESGMVLPTSQSRVPSSSGGRVTLERRKRAG